MTAGNERSGSRGGGAEKPQRHKPRFKWTAPFAWFEWCTEWIAYWLNRWALIQVIQSVAALTILWTAFTYLSGADEREQQSYNQAWQVINSAEGQGGSGGRIGAMQGLNEAGQSLSGVTAEDAVLAGIDLHSADLQEANLQNSTLEGANLREADLWNASLQGASLGEYYGAEEPIQTNLREAILEQADVRGADLSSADLSGALLNSTDLRRAILDEAKLQGAELKEAVLEDASLVGANLQGAELEGTELWNADFSGANLQGAKHLTQDELNGAIGDWETQLPEGLQRPSWWYDRFSNKLREGGPLPPGDYDTTAFNIPFSFTVGEGWETDGSETPVYIGLDQRDTGLGWFFVVPEEVYDPHNFASEGVSPLPKDMVAWLRGHPYLHAQTKPVELNLGGVAGRQFDVQVPVMPSDYSVDLCDSPCLPLFPDQRGEGSLRIFEGGYRLGILEVQGETVVIIQDLEQGTPAKAEEILKTVKWAWMSS